MTKKIDIVLAEVCGLRLDFQLECYDDYSEAICHSLCMCRSLRSVDKFISFIGLDKPAVEPGADDLCGINRSQVCINHHHRCCRST